MKARDAFAIAPPNRRKGKCAGCGRQTERDERVMIRVASFAIEGRKQVGLESFGTTFCAECARDVYDRAADVVRKAAA